MERRRISSSNARILLVRDGGESPSRKYSRYSSFRPLSKGQQNKKGREGLVRLSCDLVAMAVGSATGYYGASITSHDKHVMERVVPRCASEPCKCAVMSDIPK